MLGGVIKEGEVLGEETVEELTGERDVVVFGAKGRMWWWWCCCGCWRRLGERAAVEGEAATPPVLASLALMCFSSSSSFCSGDRSLAKSMDRESDGERDAADDADAFLAYGAAADGPAMPDRTTPALTCVLSRSRIATIVCCVNTYLSNLYSCVSRMKCVCTYVCKYVCSVCIGAGMHLHGARRLTAAISTSYISNTNNNIIAATK